MFALKWQLHSLTFRLSKNFSINGTHSKLHRVLCKCASLVCEDIPDLPQVFIQVRTPNCASLILLFVIHVNVSLNEPGLDQAGYVQSNIEAYGDQTVE